MVNDSSRQNRPQKTTHNPLAFLRRRNTYRAGFCLWAVQCAVSTVILLEIVSIDPTLLTAKKQKPRKKAAKQNARTAVCTPHKYHASFDNGSVATTKGGDLSGAAMSPLACVSRSGEKCYIRRCHNESDAASNNGNDTTLFGYAGRLIDRGSSRLENNRIHGVMKIGGGGRDWGQACVVSHKYRFVYLHNLKSGGTAIKEFLKKSFCGEDNADCEGLDPGILAPTRCQNAVRDHDCYFVWSFARNPFSRLYSMYAMTAGYERKKSPLKPMNNSFRSFAMHPTSRTKYTFMSSSHYLQQRAFLFDAMDCPSFDFLGRLERFGEDFERLLGLLRVPEMSAYYEKNNGVTPQNTWGTDKKTRGLGGDLRNAYTETTVVNRTVGYYRDDFELLGYGTSREDIPQF